MRPSPITFSQVGHDSVSICEFKPVFPFALRYSVWSRHLQIEKIDGFIWKERHIQCQEERSVYGTVGQHTKCQDQCWLMPLPVVDHFPFISGMMCSSLLHTSSQLQTQQKDLPDPADVSDFERFRAGSDIPTTMGD